MAQDIKSMEVLAFGSENAIVAQVAAKTTVDHANELRLLRTQQGVTGKEAFRQKIAQKEHLSYSAQSAEGLKSRWGAGAASVDQQGVAQLAVNATAEQRGVYQEAVNAIDKSSRILTYLELADKPLLQRNAEYIVLLGQAQRVDLQGYANFDALRQEALNSIARDPSFRAMFPELWGNAANNVPISDDQRRTFIEETLAKDPLFKAKYSERMSAIHEAALKLQETTDPNLQEVKRKKAEQEITLNQQAPNGELGVAISQAKQTQNILTQNTNQITAQEAANTPEKAQQRAQRIMAERRLLGQMDTLLGEAVADVWDTRYDEMVPLEAKKQENALKVTSEKKGAKIAFAQKRVQDETKTRWIRIESGRGKIMSINNMKEDLDRLIYEGENGRRRLIMKNVFSQNPNITVSRVDFQGNKNDVVVHWDTINFTTDELKGEDKEMFDTVYTAEAANYSNKLFKDYYLTRALEVNPLARKIGSYNFEGSPINLKYHLYELQALSDTFGTDLEAAFKASKPAQDLLHRLDKNGANEAGGLLKFILAIAALLGYGSAKFGMS